MRTGISTTFGFLLVLVAGAVAAQAQGRFDIPLPLDPSTPVIVLDYRGGWVPNRRAEPALLVRADGRVSATEAFNPGTFEDRITPAEFQELLHFIIADQHFFEFNAEEVNGELNVQRRRIIIDDVSTTHIRIKTRDREMEASFYALGFYAEMHPSIKPLVQLAAIEQRLGGMVKVAMAGGIAALEEALRQANEFVRSHPDYPTLTIADYVNTSYRPPARRKAVLFVHEMGNGKAVHVTVASTLDERVEVTGEIKPSEEDLLEYLKSLADRAKETR